jgi:hypothetical protein
MTLENGETVLDLSLKSGRAAIGESASEIGDMVIVTSGVTRRLSSLVVGDSVVVCPTLGGGQLAIKASAMIHEGYLMAIESLGSGVILVAAKSGRLYRSVNYGSTFPATTVPSGAEYFTHFLNLGDGVVLASSYARQIWRSEDYGVTWTLVHTAGEKVNCFASLPGTSEYLYATTDDYKLLRSPDDGLSWSQIFDFSSITSTEGYITPRVAITTDGVAVSIGHWGAIYLSSDDGVNFSLSHTLGTRRHYDDDYSEYYIYTLISMNSGGTLFVGGIRIDTINPENLNQRQLYYYFIGPLYWNGSEFSNYVGSTLTTNGATCENAHAIGNVTCFASVWGAAALKVSLSSSGFSTQSIMSETDQPFVTGFTDISTTVKFLIRNDGQIWRSNEQGAPGTWSLAVQLYCPN